MAVPKIKMETEIPVCKRCCFCLPLRYGLLVWSYFKIIAYLFLIPLMVYYLVMIILLITIFVGIRNAIQTTEFVTQIVVAIATLVTLITDLVATIVFIVAGHKKNVKLMRVFYFYSIAVFIMTALLATTIVCMLFGYWVSSKSGPGSGLESMLIICSTYFVVLVQQTYFLLLLRSEILKLRIVGEFRFVNNAAEAECAMKYPELEEGEGKQIEDGGKKEMDEGEKKAIDESEKSEIEAREKKAIEEGENEIEDV